MTLLALVDAVIREQAAPPKEPTVAFPDVLAALYTTGFTGRIYIDFAEGRPKAVWLPNPVGVKIN